MQNLVDRDKATESFKINLFRVILCVQMEGILHLAATKGQIQIWPE